MSAAPRDRFVSDGAFDDAVQHFSVVGLSVRGRVARLGLSIDDILKRHAYPEPVSRLLGEAAVLTLLLGSALKEQGRFQLQTRTNGPVHLIVVDFDAPDKIRACARFDSARLESETGNLLGEGHLGFTIERAQDQTRYQGVVALEGETLEQAAQKYFERSEQTPTFVRLAVGESMTDAQTHWRAGGLMIQSLPAASASAQDLDDAEQEDPEEAWSESCALAATVEDHELLDPTLSGERLLYRLFHQRGVRAFEAQRIHAQCRCSQEGVFAMLKSFKAEDRQSMIDDDGEISVTCEFCSTKRAFKPAEFTEA